MMIIENKERVSVIGKLIGIYREEKRNNSQNEYTLSKFSEGICSVNTLKSIELGNRSRSEEVYGELLEKLNLKYGYFPVVDEAIDNLIEKIYDAVVYFRVDEIDDLTTKAIRILDKVKDYVYYSELLEVLEDIRNYYMESIMVEEYRYERYIQLYRFISFQILKDLFVTLMYSRFQKDNMNDKTKYNEFIESYEIDKSNFIAVRMLKIHYYYIFGQYLELNKILETFETILIAAKNHIRLIDVYRYKIMMHSNINPISVKNTIDKINENLEICKLPKNKLQETYSTIGNSLHYLGKFNEALVYYEKTLNIDVDHHIINILFMADCQSRLGKEIKIPAVSNKYLENFPLEMQTMYNYFAYYDMPNFVKENYILKKIAPTLCDLAFIEVFKFQMQDVVEKTGHYKKMFTFNKIIEGNLMVKS